jgi:MerR family transcriptional regulator, light-induced transcriptional regulator
MSIMAFLRVKKVKDIDYLYLVQSKWDPYRKTSTQNTIKYLGKASDVTIENIPQEYKNNSRILSTLNSKTKKNSKTTLLNEDLKKQVLNALKNREVEQILRMIKTYEKEFSLSEFYDDILKHVLYEIGQLWEQNELDVASEHVCSNTANETIYRINESHLQNKNKPDILLCTPDGELHNIACNIIGSIFLQKGYKVHNISPSAPTETILKYIKEINPSLIMISVTLKDNLESSKRLIKNINMKFRIPIILGGWAIKESNERQKKDIELIGNNVKIITDTTLEELTRVVEKLTKNTAINNILVQSIT